MVQPVVVPSGPAVAGTLGKTPNPSDRVRLHTGTLYQEDNFSPIDRSKHSFSGEDSVNSSLSI